MDVHKVDLFFSDKRNEILVFQFLSGTNTDVLAIHDLKEYRGEFLFMDFSLLSFKTLLYIVYYDIKGFFVIFFGNPVFKWYHAYVMRRILGMISTPFGSTDFRKALKVLLMKKRGIK